MTNDVAAAPATALRLEGLSKRFSGVQALRDVSFDIRAGEVLALLGENGAGKSTLLRILGGDHRPDSGHISIGGTPYAFASPHDAQRAGVRIIPQEPEIVPDVAVAENVHIGALRSHSHLYRRRALVTQTNEEIARFGFAGVIDAAMLGGRLSPAQRQLVEILRALINDVRIIAFDEPTSSLSDHEVEALFTLITDLRANGVAVVYVSHRLNEVFRVADRVVVLRDGQYVGERPIAGSTPDDLVRMMVGRDLEERAAEKRRAPGEVVLALDHVTTDDVHDVTFDVRAGEVVALAGLVGAGRTELARAIVGDVRLRSGTIAVDGVPLHLRGPRDAVLAGIGLAPEERKAEALLMERSVRDNVSLAVLDRISRLHVVRLGEERRIVRRFVDQLRIRTPSTEQEVGKLSGGNQQKVVLARWLARRPKVLILDEPTRGVDVGAKAEIHAIIGALAADGVAVLVISSELPEVLRVADRIVVMQQGRVAGQLDPAEATEERILTLAIGDH